MTADEQRGGSMLDCPQIAMGHGKVDVGAIHWQGRTGIILHPRERFIPIGEDGDLNGDYWPTPDDVVIWIDAPEGGQVIIDEINALRAALSTPSQPGQHDAPGMGE